MTSTTRTRILQIDAAGCAVVGVALVAAAGSLIAPFALSSPWPLQLLGLAFLVYAAENLWVARRPSANGLAMLAATDLLFGVGAIAVALINPTGAETWVRWSLAALGDVSLVFGAVKLLGLRSLRQAATAQEVRA